MKSDKAERIIRAAIEAGVLSMDELTIVIVANRDAELDVGATAPSEAAANLIRPTLLLALRELNGRIADLKSKVEVGKS